MDRIEPTLVGKILTLHSGLTDGGIRHAFGGALALAYYTLEPRATADIDVNVTVDPAEASAVFAVLPDGVAWTDHDIDRVHHDEQVRLWWGRTPLDLFFRAAEFHDAVADRVEWHAFGGEDLPFLSAHDLAVFKALFDRPKDWLDITAMYDAGAITRRAVAESIQSLLGDDDRVQRLLDLGNGTEDGPVTKR